MLTTHILSANCECTHVGVLDHGCHRAFQQCCSPPAGIDDEVPVTPVVRAAHELVAMLQDLDGYLPWKIP